jgi:hypothetical protein
MKKEKQISLDETTHVPYLNPIGLVHIVDPHPNPNRVGGAES